MPKVLAINGSPRMEKGHTALVLGHFLEGIKEEGASVEIIYTKKLKIKPCIGDFQCWHDKIGVCIQKDDMQALYKKLKNTEILVIGSPIYLPLPGELQNLFNRIIPLYEPILEFRDGRTRLKFHDDVKIFKIVLVGTGGWWEVENLDLVVGIVKHIATDAGVEFGGAVLRPHAQIMRENKDKAKEVIAALRRAGQLCVKGGNISSDVLSAISQPLISEPELRARQNQWYLKAKQEQSITGYRRLFSR